MITTSHGSLEDPTPPRRQGPFVLVTDSPPSPWVLRYTVTLAQTNLSWVTIKPERLLELCFERNLVGGRSLTLLAVHDIACSIEDWRPRLRRFMSLSISSRKLLLAGHTHGSLRESRSRRRDRLPVSRAAPGRPVGMALNRNPFCRDSSCTDVYFRTT